MGDYKLSLADEQATESLARCLAYACKAGDVLLLSGPLGAGKSCFARAFIRMIAGDPVLEVPSPTFTLVQTYPTEPPITHADLWRVADASEVVELGLEWNDQGIALIEWPDRLGDQTPDQALRVELDWADGAGRTVRLQGPDRLIDRVRANKLDGAP